MAAPVFAWAEAEVQTPPAAVQMPPAAVQTPPAAVQAPPAEVQTPPAAVQMPPAAVQTPPAAVQAPAPTPQVANTAATGMGGQLLQLLFGLLLVIGLIFVLAWVMRRVQRVGPNSGQLIELLGSRALGPRDRLMLVQVGNEQILLGITPGRITPLHVLKEPVQVPVREQVTPDFAQHLLKLMGKDKDKK